MPLFKNNKMKKLVLVIAIGIGMASCTKEVCITCKSTKVDNLFETYCGDPKEAKDWEKNLKDNVRVYQGEWICNKQKFK
jgi:hypothetical protein